MFLCSPSCSVSPFFLLWGKHCPEVGEQPAFHIFILLQYIALYFVLVIYVKIYIIWISLQLTVSFNIFDYSVSVNVDLVYFNFISLYVYITIYLSFLHRRKLKIFLISIIKKRTEVHILMPMWRRSLLNVFTIGTVWLQSRYIISFTRYCQIVSLKWLYPPVLCLHSTFSHQQLVFSDFKVSASIMSVMKLIMALICFRLTAYKVAHLFICFWPFMFLLCELSIFFYCVFYWFVRVLYS